MNKLQRGFTLVESLLTILIVAVIGFGGYYVWHTHHSTKPLASTKSTPAKKTTTPATSQSAPAQKYLTITEWSVKLPLTGNTSDAYYADKNGYIYLSLRSLATTNCSADSTTLGAITRYQSNDLIYPSPGSSGETVQQFIASAQPAYTKIGNYYYIYTHPQAACSEDTATLDKANAAMTDFKNATANIQAE